MYYHPLSCCCSIHPLYTPLNPHAVTEGVCGTCWVPFGDWISGIQRASSCFPAVYFRDLLICSLTAVKEENIHQGSLIMVRAPGVCGWGGMHAGARQAFPQWIWLKELWAPHDSVVTKQPQESVLWPRDVDWCACLCVRGRRGRGKETQMLRFLFTPQFHVHYKSVPSKVNVKTLQINPESDRSSLSCLWYHFPSKWYGWVSDNCHPDLASLHHSPKTH